MKMSTTKAELTKESLMRVFSPEKRSTKRVKDAGANEIVLPPPNEDAVIESIRKKSTAFENFTTIYVLGSGAAGKSLLINRILDKTDITKPTLGLDFTFARRNIADPEYPVQLQTIKQVCNIWELGGDVIQRWDLIHPPIVTNRALDKLAIFLVLDLSVPDKLWATLEAAISHLKKAVTRTLSENLRNNLPDVTKKLDENIATRLGPDFPDKRYIEPFPLPVVIICTKYDVFQEYEPERRKLICRMLRLASNRLGASLIFFSKNELAHSRRVRELFTHYAFGTPFPKGNLLDPNKGIFISHGGDSYEQIWPGCNPNQFTMDHFTHLFETQIGKYQAKAVVKKEDPSEDPVYREPLLDARRALLQEELRVSLQKKGAKNDSYAEN